MPQANGAAQRFYIEALAIRDVGPVTLAVAAGECVCVSGDSGAGKSLLLRALADLEPARGRVYLDGAERATVAATHWRREVALLPADNHWWHDRVAAHFPAQPVYGLEALGLAPAVMQRSADTLSNGERQRLALLRILQRRPRVLLLDEPTANLDPDSCRRVEALLGDYSRDRGAPIIWVSHDPGQVSRVADRHVRLASGRLQQVPR